MATPVGIGIIGTGFGASVQLPGFLRITDAHVIGIASRESGKSKVYAEQYALPQSFDSWQELVASPAIQLVSITTPPLLHAEIADACIAAGKAILCEKPFTMHVPEAERLFKSAETAGIVHAMDFEFRDIPAWTFFHDHVKSSSIGNIVRADFQWIVGSWADPKRTWRWQCDAAAGGGILGALGVHLFDAVEWVLGPVASLTASTRIGIPERPDDSGQMQTVTAEDQATIDMTLESSVPVQIKLSNVDTAGKGLLMKVTGEQGSVMLQSTSQNYGSGFFVKEQMNGGEQRVLFEDHTKPDEDARIPPFESLARRVIAAIQANDRTFRPSFYEGMRSQLILDAVRVSASSGSQVDIRGAAK